jgi:HJR/Mrr/RecB family endonuclease
MHQKKKKFPFLPGNEGILKVNVKSVSLVISVVDCCKWIKIIDRRTKCQISCLIEQVGRWTRIEIETVYVYIYFQRWYFDVEATAKEIISYTFKW